MKNLPLKLGAIGIITALAVWAFTPPSQKIRLGLDLQGGVHLVLAVKTDDAVRLETETVSEQVKQALKDKGITVTTKPGAKEFAVEGLAPESDQQFRAITDPLVTTSFNRDPGPGGSYVFRMKPNVEVTTRAESVTQAILTIEKRVNELGVSEPTIAPYGSAGDQIIVQLPGLKDVARAKDIIKSTAVLEIKLVNAGPLSDEATLLQPYAGQLPADMQVVQGTEGTGASATRMFYLVRKVAAVTGRDLRNARATLDEYNEPAVSFTLNPDGVSKFSVVTRENIGKRLAIVLDNQVQSAPVIETAIPTAEARITGRFTQQEVTDLALVLRSGALPARLDYLEQRQVGPSLGADSIRSGIVASVTGLALVTIFMFLYYRLSGFNAFVSIVLNLVILLGSMAYIGAVMTLPGIAGFILTIGMGVDSNVLIFERIREELENRKSARQAVAAGFGRVFWTIVDTHVASLIAAAFLFQFGTGPIRGFATTLVFGLLSNVFTAVFVSRTMFEFVLSRKPAGATELSI